MVWCVLSWREKGRIERKYYWSRSLTVQVLISFSDCVSDGTTPVQWRQAVLEMLEFSASNCCTFERQNMIG